MKLLPPPKLTEPAPKPTAKPAQQILTPKEAQELEKLQQEKKELEDILLKLEEEEQAEEEARKGLAAAPVPPIERALVKEYAASPEEGAAFLKEQAKKRGQQLETVVRGGEIYAAPPGETPLPLDPAQGLKGTLQGLFYLTPPGAALQAKRALLSRFGARKKPPVPWLHPRAREVLQDIADIHYTVPASIAEGIAVAGGGLSGALSPVPGGALLGATGAAAAAATASELGRQALGKALGLRQKYDPKEMAQSAALGGALAAFFGPGAHQVARQVIQKKGFRVVSDAALEKRAEEALKRQGLKIKGEPIPDIKSLYPNEKAQLIRSQLEPGEITEQDYKNIVQGARGLGGILMDAGTKAFPSTLAVASGIPAPVLETLLKNREALERMAKDKGALEFEEKFLKETKATLAAKKLREGKAIEKAILASAPVHIKPAMKPFEQHMQQLASIPKEFRYPEIDDQLKKLKDTYQKFFSKRQITQDPFGIRETKFYPLPEIVPANLALKLRQDLLDHARRHKLTEGIKTRFEEGTPKHEVSLISTIEDSIRALDKQLKSPALEEHKKKYRLVKKGERFLKKYLKGDMTTDKFLTTLRKKPKLAERIKEIETNVGVDILKPALIQETYQQFYAPTKKITDEFRITEAINRLTPLAKGLGLAGAISASFAGIRGGGSMIHAGLPWLIGAGAGQALAGKKAAKTYMRLLEELPRVQQQVRFGPGLYGVSRTAWEALQEP